MKPKIISIVGTTASGKSDLGLALAEKYHGEIVSADSRQIYKGLDLGTGKETPEELNRVPHHLIDILEPNKAYSLAEYQNEAYRAIQDILSRKRLPFLVGGTGLYTRSVVEGYQLVDVAPDEEFRKEMENKTKEELLELLKTQYGIIDENPSVSPRRLIRRLEILRSGNDDGIHNQPRYTSLQIGMTYDRKTLCERIEKRLDRRIELGMIEEVRHLMNEGATPEFLYNLGLEYRFTSQYILGQFSGFNEYHDKLLTAIRQFSKRQLTWFKKEKDIHWLDMNLDPVEQAVSLIDKFLAE